ncbi:hypothetical protein [Devosia nitrariae]|nr:hypothetical protein [Devosia nitrariae]
MQPTFKSLEQLGWTERAAGYDEYTARITNPGIAPLLAAAKRRVSVCSMLAAARGLSPPRPQLSEPR